jgi:hypothetical protein
MTKRAKRAPYTRERRAEALALARIAGAEVASERTHVPVQTIRRWMDAAGIQPGTSLPQERLEALRDLAEASVTRDLVEGRIRGVQAMTVAGIARRHIGKPAPAPQPDEQTTAQQAMDELEAQIDAIYPGVDLSLAIAVLLAHVRLTFDDEAEADTSVAGWLDVLARLVEEHGSIEAAEQWQRAEEHRRLEEQLERNRISAERAIASSRQAMLDNETRSLLAAAEAFLRESPDA